MVRKLCLILISTIVLNASSLDNKIINIIGYQTFNENKGLIDHIFANNGSNTNFITILQKLKNNGLLNVGYNSPQNVTITFNINQDPIKSIKIVSDSMKALGYYHYFTKKLEYNENSDLIWTINLKTEAAIDPLMLSKELAKHNSKVVDIKKEGFTSWMYSVDTSYSSLSKAKRLVSGQAMNFRKPLKPYFVKIDSASTILINSKPGNQWFPQVVFYDRHLNILEIIKEDSKQKQMILPVPNDTRYIKIDDIYTLANLKRGLNVTIK